MTSRYGTNCDNFMMSKSRYISLSNGIVKCYNQYNRNPSKIKSGNQTMNFDDTIYLYSRIIDGIGLALNADGADDLNDVTNTYYWVKASPIIIFSALPVGGEYSDAIKGAKVLSKASKVSKSDRIKYVITTNQNVQGINSAEDAFHEWVKSDLWNEATDKICNGLNLTES